MLKTHWTNYCPFLVCTWKGFHLRMWWHSNNQLEEARSWLDQWEGSLLQKGFLGPSLNQDYWGFSMWPFWRHGCCSNCLICYEEYCVYLSFALLSELQHFGLLSQYYRPLGSWSALLVSSFLLVTTRLARQRGVTFSLDRCVLFFLQLSLSFFLFLLSFLFYIFSSVDIVKALLNGWRPCGWYLAAANATSLL